MVLHTSQHFSPKPQSTTQSNTPSPKNFLKIFQFNANSIRNKTDEMQPLIENTQLGINTRVKTEAIPQIPNIPYFTPIRTDRTYTQRKGLTYIKNNINFSQHETLSTSPLEQQIIKIHHPTYNN